MLFIMPLPVLCFVLLWFAIFAGDCAAESPGSLSLESRVGGCLERLCSDSPTARRKAKRKLLELATDADSTHRQTIIQVMLRGSLCSDLETQLSVERLIDEIETLEHHECLQRLLRGGENDTDPGSELTESWGTFSGRASGDADARAAFRQVALIAGPDLRWPRLHARVPQGNVDLLVLSQLGCLAPETPRLFATQSHLVLSRLNSMRFRSKLPGVADRNRRVIGRLIDRTLRDNVYGWTIPQRQGIALAYQRDTLSASLIDEIMNLDQALARDLAYTMLAWRRLSRLGIDPPGSSGYQRRAIGALDDRRVVGVSAERLVVQTPAPKRAPETPTIIRTRVQDVAGWALMEGTGVDVRMCGMRSLRADPVWGVALASIGFATEPERERFLGSVRARVGAARHRSENH